MDSRAMLMLDTLRAEFARKLAEDPSVRFSMDRALEHVITIVYEHGMNEAIAMGREACIALCREVAERYPTDVFPEDGQSLDCKSARMARLTAANIEHEIAERHNA